MIDRLTDRSIDTGRDTVNHSGGDIYNLYEKQSLDDVE